MAGTSYNLQEVLSPLMQKFGRHMPAGRAEGYQRLVSVVSEALEVDRGRAEQLVTSLLSSGLVGFDAASAPVGARSPASSHRPGSYVGAESARGVWRIGPSL